MDRRSLLRSTGVALAGLGVSSSTAASTSASAASLSAFTPLSQLPLSGAKEAVVDASGQTVFVAVTDGFATVDVSDPSTPRVLVEQQGLLADREDGPLEDVFDVALDGDRLAVVGPAHGGGLQALLVYDVSDPASPQQVAVHDTDFPIHNCDLADGVAYLTGNDGEGNPLVVVDVSDEPTELARWSLYDDDEAWIEVHLGARVIHDVTVVDDVAYCCYWDTGTWLLDVSDPADPTHISTVGGFTIEDFREMSKTAKAIGTVEPPGNDHYADVSDDGSVLAIGGESWEVRAGDDEGGPSGIRLWDVSDPTSPDELATVDPVVPDDATFEGTWTTAHNFDLVGDRLYSSWYQDGVKIHDVSDPSAPELLAHWRAPDETRFWTAQLGRAGEFFVASDMGTRPDDGEEGDSIDDAGLYCFPDAAGTQPDQPSIATATASSSPTQDDSPTTTGTATETEATTDTGTATGTTRSTTPETTTDTAPLTVTSSEPPASPGFGPVAAIGGLTAVVWHRLRRSR